MKVYKIGYNFKSTKSAPRVVAIAAPSYDNARTQLDVQLWWDCIDTSEVVVNLVGVAPIK